MRDMYLTRVLAGIAICSFIFPIYTSFSENAAEQQRLKTLTSAERQAEELATFRDSQKTYPLKEYVVQNGRPAFWLVVVAFNVLLAIIFWALIGRDEEGRGTVVPSDEAIADIKPYEAGVLLRERSTYEAYVGMLLDLERRKAVKFSRLEGGGYLMFDIERVHGQQNLDGVEGPVLKRLMMYSTTNDTKEEEAGQATLGKHSEQSRLAYVLFEKLIYRRLVSRGWFTAHPLHVRILSALILVGWSYTTFCFLDPRVADPHLRWLFIQIPLILPIVYFLPALTKEGALARERARGLERYLEVAEKDRLAFHDNPESAQVDKHVLLPYAVALGIERDWTKQYLRGYKEVKKTDRVTIDRKEIGTD